MKSHKHDCTKIHKARGHQWLEQSGLGQCLNCQHHTNSTSQPRKAACSERAFSWGREYQLVVQFSTVSPKKHIQFTLYKLIKLQLGICRYHAICIQQQLLRKEAMDLKESREENITGLGGRKEKG